MADEEFIKILKHRYAKGEITEKQYKEMLKDLVGEVSKSTNANQINKKPNNHLVLKSFIIMLILIVVAIFITQTGIFNPPKPLTLTPLCASGNLCEVQPTCPSNFYFNSSSIPPQCFYKYWNYNNSTTQVGHCNGATCNFTVQVLPPCPAYAVWENNQNCESPPTACIAGAEYNNYMHMCVPPPQCPPSYIFNHTLGKCVLYDACPAGYKLILTNPPICQLSTSG